MKKQNIIVFGLKSFGQSIVKQLYRYNCDVLAIDKDMDMVEEIAYYATEAIQIDIKDSLEMSKIDLDSFDVAIITMKDLGTSIMTAMICEEAKIPKIIVRATSKLHERILEKIGVSKVVSPDIEIGIKIAKDLMEINNREN